MFALLIIHFPKIIKRALDCEAQTCSRQACRGRPRCREICRCRRSSCRSRKSVSSSTAFLSNTTASPYLPQTTTHFGTHAQHLNHCGLVGVFYVAVSANRVLVIEQRVVESSDILDTRRHGIKCNGGVVALKPKATASASAADSELALSVS